MKNTKKKKKPLKKKFEKILKAWAKNETNEVRIIYGLAGLILLTAIILALWFALPYFRGGDKTIQDGEVDIEQQEDQEEDCNLRRGLDGVCVEKEEDQFPKLVAVMIENHIDARPLSGLMKAKVVYEAPAEGNITRFLALFPFGTQVDKVGPVRSTRPYYLDWVEEYGKPMYMHVGGSPDGLKKIKSLGIFNMDEFFRGWYFWRSTDRYAPHNTYTSNKLWEKAWDDYGENFEDKTEFQPWQFESNKVCEEDCITEITTTFMGRTYAPTWKFNSSTQQYERYELGRPYLDKASGEQIVTDTLIIQKVETEVLDNVGRLRLTTDGSGGVIVFQNGHMTEGEWRKEESKRTFWFSDDDEIKLKPGKIWIAVVPQNGEVEY